jgi:hypothetical protein
MAPQSDSQTCEEALGLLANGSSGDWEVSIDQTTSGPARLLLEIEGRSVHLDFELPSLETIPKIIDFLEMGPSSSRRFQAYRRSTAAGGKGAERSSPRG